MIIKNFLIEKYSQNGEGVGFYQNKPVYVFGTIVGEIIDCQILKEQKKFYVGKIYKLVSASPNRNYHNIPDAHLIGGYELIHMNDEEQKKFKIERVLNDFKQIANFNLEDTEYFQGKMRFYYRNKITLHDGHFYQKRTNKPIDINNYLLSSIPYDKNQKGIIIYRQLDTLIYGTKEQKKYTFDSMLNYKFRVGLNSFYQVNKEVAQEIYSDIQKYVIKDGITLDLYSGIAIIAIIVSSISKFVYGIEINKSSYNDALFNIENNNIKNIDFFCSNVDTWIEHNKHLLIDTLILDPSREGVNKKTLKTILEVIKPKRIIYLSCNPGTQSSNFNYLKEKYKVTKHKIYDMFPQTYHIESLLILDLK